VIVRSLILIPASRVVVCRVNQQETPSGRQGDGDRRFQLLARKEKVSLLVMKPAFLRVLGFRGESQKWHPGWIRGGFGFGEINSRRWLLYARVGRRCMACHRDMCIPVPTYINSGFWSMHDCSPQIRSTCMQQHASRAFVVSVNAGYSRGQYTLVQGYIPGRHVEHQAVW
jgi:hypothetical protein